MRKNDAIPRPNNTHTYTHTQCGKYVVHDTLTHRQWLRNYYRAQCLSLIQVAPGHVNEVLTIGTERVKPENPDLKR